MQEPIHSKEGLTSTATFAVSGQIGHPLAQTVEETGYTSFLRMVEAIRPLHPAAPRNVFARRALDVLVSILALALTLPFYPLIMLAIRIDSKGPALFRQVRVGRDGKLFVVYKFRSMRYAAPEAADLVYREIVSKWVAGVPLNDTGSAGSPIPPFTLDGQKRDLSDLPDGAGKGQSEQHVRGSQYKLVNDPRLTSVGRFLRKTSLDELPQFFNVLRGDMSVVGPRPAIPYEVERYTPEDYGRLLVKPGITGLWQVEGRGRVTFHQMIELDLRYVAKNSFWGDVGLIVRTIPAMLFGRGAA